MIHYQETIDVLKESKDLIIVANECDLVQKVLQALNAEISDFKDDHFSTVYALKQLEAKRVHIIGQNKLTNEESFGKVVQSLIAIKDDAVILTETFNDQEMAMVNDLVEKLITERYEIDTFKSKKAKEKSAFYFSGDKKIQSQIDEGLVYGQSINQAKDLVNAPYNYMKAKDLADHAKTLEKYEGVSVKIFERNEIEAMNMGAYLGVNKGSFDDPYLIFIKYQAKDNMDEPVALVGKGVMFDTGGYSLKPSTSMPGMKFDMAGSAAVIAAIEGIARLKLDTHVHVIVAATDNRIGDNAIVPDDILTSANGKTIEIISTDAEGRLTLADAVWFAQKEGAKKIIDVATLTGAIMAALGSYYTGAFTNNQEFFDKFKKATELSKEKIWQMPVSKEHHDELKSKVADLKNKGKRFAGASTAAAFIEEFINLDTQWIHLDIAATANDQKSGSTGVMVKSFMKFFHNNK